MDVQRGDWGERWVLQEVPKGFSAGTVQQQRGSKKRDAQIKMTTTYKDKDEDSDYSLRLVLSERQIKSWFSSEAGLRKKETVNRVFEKGFTELSQSIDMQDNQEGDHDQNGGVVEEGAPPAPPPPPPLL
jgi:hypothetical protein